MVDEIRLGVVMAVVIIAIPAFIILNGFKAQTSKLPDIGSFGTASAAQNELYASERFAASDPEEALYMMYDAQASDELKRCFSSESSLCEGTVDLIVDSCAGSQYDLAVCHDPRIEQLLSRT